MKAVLLYENGGNEKLVYSTQCPFPIIKSNEVLVKVKATSVNRVDLLIRDGYPGLNLKFPHIIGGDITGIIEETGDDVKDFKKFLIESRPLATSPNSPSGVNWSAIESIFIFSSNLS